MFAYKLSLLRPRVVALVAALTLTVLPAGCSTQEDAGTAGTPRSTVTPTTATPSTPAGGTSAGGSTNLTPSATTPPARPTDVPTGTTATGRGSEKDDQGATGPEKKAGGDLPKVIDKPAEPTPSDKEAAPKADQKED